MRINCLGEALANTNRCKRLHSCVADQSQHGRSAWLPATTVILDGDEQPTPAIPKVWEICHVTRIVPKSPNQGH